MRSAIMSWCSRSSKEALVDMPGRCSCSRGARGMGRRTVVVGLMYICNTCMQGCRSLAEGMGCAAKPNNNAKQHMLSERTGR